MKGLEKHIIDTMKEWQIKIGYQEGEMKLYYPGSTLIELLDLPEDIGEDGLHQALDEFFKWEEPLLGKITISGNMERYCLTIPKEGCAYVAEQVEDPVFLKRFLEVITDKNATMEQVRACFLSYAKECNLTLHEEDESGDELGHVFYFEGETEETYVYCVEQDVFGITYHRFTWQDFKRL